MLILSEKIEIIFWCRTFAEKGILLIKSFACELISVLINASTKQALIKLYVWFYQLSYVYEPACFWLSEFGLCSI